MNKLVIPAYSALIGISKFVEKEIKEASKYIFTKDKDEIRNILLKMKVRFPNAKNMIYIINYILNDQELLDKCVLNEINNSGIYANISATLCPLRDNDQSKIEFDFSSILYDKFYKWMCDNKGKNEFDFIKENDIETLFITINNNSDYRVKYMTSFSLDDFDYWEKIDSWRNYLKYNDPQYGDILFMKNLYKR